MIDNLDIILKEGETDFVEFQESPDKGLPSEVCALANASGGTVYVGVHDDGYVVGTDTSNAARSRVQDSLNKIEPRLNFKIDVHDNIFIITVPEGANKPYSCPAGFYLRTGTNSQKLNRDSIIEFLQDENLSKYDEIVRKDLPLDDLFDESAYKKYINAAKISDVLGKETTLVNLDCAALIDDKYYFTNAGALFFRKNDEDTKFRHARVTCALYKGIDKTYIIDVKELYDDIISNIDESITFLKRHLNLSYKIVTTRRENILELPEVALKEAVTNAVCHRNYFERGARVMVEIFDNRVDITSPGGVCKGITAENFGTVSITRNNIIAEMLHRIDYIEEMGTGIMRMKNAAREADVAEPEFILQDFFKVTFKRKEDLSENVNYKADKTTGKKSSDKTVIGSDKNSDRLAIDSERNSDRLAISNEKHLIIYQYVKQNQKGKSADFVKLLELSPQRVRQILQDMIKNDIIEKHGERRHTYYTIKEGETE